MVNVYVNLTSTRMEKPQHRKVAKLLTNLNSKNSLLIFQPFDKLSSS